MANLLAPLFCLIGQWLESRGMEAVAIGCYQLAGNQGGKAGAKALWRVGNILFACGQLPDALAAYQESVKNDPTNANAWCDLGIAYREEGRLDEARRCYDLALEIAPANLLVLTRIGELHLAQGEPVVALTCFERVLEQAPLYFEAMGYRIAALAECDRLAEAEQVARQAIEHYPESAGLLISLGSVLIRSGKTRLGQIAYKQALEIDPANQEARFNLAIAQDNSQALAEAIEFIRQKIKREGEPAYLQGLLALALHHTGEVAQAETVCRKLLAQHPAYAPGWRALSGIAKTQGDVGKSIEYLNKVLELKPDASEVFSDALFMSTYLPDSTEESVFKLHLEWAQRYETPLLEKKFQHVPETEARHRLKIGYLSGDLRSHPVGLLLRGVLEQHDHDKFEIHCFSTSYKAHPLTEILRRLSDHWHEVQLLSTVELAALIHELRIDILVDLSGHTAENRLKVFALKPAPVQATWIGYFHSTGLASIDYFITDPHTTPPESDQLFSELPVRLPHSRFCYTPHGFAPKVSAPPADQTGHVMFGSFNRLPKLVDPVIDAWSRIVLSVPDARLMIKADGLNDAATAERIKRKFEAHGLAPERLVLRPRSDHLKLLEDISEADIALDPFPFNGGMTTMDSLWMGVPVVALAGNSVVSRQSASVLANLGLEELIFPDVESYIAGAVALALDTSRLASLRSIIRPRMSRSPLCDAEQFTSDLETLYRRMWRAWCLGEKLGPEIVPGPPVARNIVPSGSVAWKSLRAAPVVRKIVPSAPPRKVPSDHVARRTVLHVGCGQATIRHLPAYFQTHWKEIRLDIDPDVHPDIVGTALDMSGVSSYSVDAVYSSHTLEHLYAHELPIALREMKRVLRPDGIMVATVPDLQAAACMIAEDRLFETAYQSPAGPITPFDIVYSYRGFVSRDRPYMAHHGGFTLTTLIDAIKHAGFEAVTGKRRTSAYDLWVIATPEPMSNDQLDQLASEVFP